MHTVAKHRTQAELARQQALEAVIAERASRLLAQQVPVQPLSDTCVVQGQGCCGCGMQLHANIAHA